jgi:siroheme synthase (precorrin-2 oxidase/ferrochelatase)
MTDEKRYYFACLDLDGRRCLVVGGGKVGLEKAKGLLDCSGRHRRRAADRA